MVAGGSTNGLMKLSRPIPVIMAFLLTGCQSTFGPMLGMTEKEWQHRTLVGDLVYMEDDVKAYHSFKASDETTKAGRCLVLLKSVNGKGT